MSDSKIEIKKEIVERLKIIIVTKEAVNLKTREKSGPAMVNQIMQMIEKEVKCYSKQ